MKKYFFASLVIFFSLTLFAQDRLQVRIDSIVTSVKNKYGLVGVSVAVTRCGEMIYTKSFGSRNLKTRKPVTESSVFHTASISKLFTAFAVVKLSEQKRFALDDTFKSLIPEFRMADERYHKITVRQLLNHTSGIPDVVNYHWSNTNNVGAEPLKDYMMGLSGRKLKSNPGEHFLYSSMGYELLGHLIEKTTGESYDEYMKQAILMPSGMNNSNFNYLKIPDTLQTSPHSKRPIFKNVYTRKIYPYNPAHAPSSTLNASSYDLALWVKDLLNALSKNCDMKNLSAPSLRMMLTPSEEFKFIGLGWFIGKLNNCETFFHFGGDRGFRSYLLIIPSEEIGLVLLSNCDYDEDFRQEILHPIVSMLQKK